MAGRTLMLAACAMILAGCEADRQAQERRETQGAAAMAAAGSRAKLLAVCGPFAAVTGASGSGAVGDEKYVAFVERMDGPLMVRTPFVLEANPPVRPDPDLVAVDDAGRPLPPAKIAYNTSLAARESSPGQSSFTALVWRVDAAGGPVGEDRETFVVKKTPVRHEAQATVFIADKTTRYTAPCS